MQASLSRELPPEDWHLLEVPTVVTHFDTSPVTGLSEAGVIASLARHGHNVLPEAKPRAWLEILLAQFITLPVALLTAPSLTFDEAFDSFDNDLGGGVVEGFD